MAIDTDATFETEDDTANAFLKLMGAEELPEDERKEGETEADKAEDKEAKTEAEETDSETEDAETSSEDAEETEGEAEEETKAKKYADDEGTYVKVKVGEEEHEVAVKDLKRLFGQEATLTKKSMEVAERTKAAEAAQAKSLAALDVMVKRAQEAANPYRNVNWAALMKDPNISAEDVGALQEAAKSAFENETFLTGSSTTSCKRYRHSSRRRKPRRRRRVSRRSPTKRRQPTSKVGIRSSTTTCARSQSAWELTRRWSTTSNT